MVESKKGVSANQLKRMLGISYKTAWYLLSPHPQGHGRSKARLYRSGNTSRLDETYVGAETRTWAVGAWKANDGARGLERGGEVRFRVEKREEGEQRTLHRFIIGEHPDDTKRTMTDELPAYNGIHDADTTHEA